jgi:S1-C subfamily serine protease
MFVTGDEPSPAAVRDRTRRLERVRASLRRATPFIVGVVVTLLGLGAWSSLQGSRQQLTTDQVDQRIAQALASAPPPPPHSLIVQQVAAPSVVLVRAEDADGGDPEIGSGVVVDAAGDILTSLHVVAEATTVRVTFADGTDSPAYVIGEVEDNDIAVLQAVRAPELLVPAILGDPGAVQVGDEAFAIGNPFGLSLSITSGVVSGLRRSIEHPETGQPLDDLIQFDAAVNPGSSGGPLLNRDGHVIGIVAALLNPTQQRVFVGIGLAVPITLAGGAVDMPPY